MTVVHLLNHFPTSALNGKTPYEAWHRRNLVVSYMRVFGCLAFVKELNHVASSMIAARQGVFIGYAEGAKAYRVLDPATWHVRVARDVVFDEGRGWAWDKWWMTGWQPRSATSLLSTHGLEVLREHKVHLHRRLGLHHQRRPLHQLR